MISNDEKKKILHRRWAITAFIAVIFITAMELWSIVFAIFFMFLVIILIFGSLNGSPAQILTAITLMR